MCNEHQSIGVWLSGRMSAKDFDGYSHGKFIKNIEIYRKVV
ncbi:hypothetical protein HMPREF1867_01241 [Veillonella dispar]|nr:hypothetical protein HMPREF1867_01241 [Veillonella dispar]